ncbi:MAG: hypothetical protein KBC02_01420 [Candidatus Pacebacteria bacterium]|nr:hypothetical protein [Candidatus Paceibacterota bacterium]
MFSEIPNGTLAFYTGIVVLWAVANLLGRKFFRKGKNQSKKTFFLNQ